jgi:hypothetical protein
LKRWRLLACHLRANGVDGRLALILTHNLTALTKLSQQTSGRVERNSHELRNLSASALRILSKPLSQRSILSLTLELSLRGLRTPSGIPLSDQFDLMINERNLISVSEIGADSSEHFGLSHSNTSFLTVIGSHPKFDLFLTFGTSLLYHKFRGLSRLFFGFSKNFFKAHTLNLGFALPF